MLIKRLLICGGSIFLCILFGIIVKCSKDQIRETNLISYEQEYKNDWAFYNYGQYIDGVKGIDGVDINIFAAWNVTKGNRKVKIGIVDTGIEISDNIEKHIVQSEKLDDKDDDGNGYIDDLYGWDFYNNDNSIYDKYSHDYHGTYITNEILKVAPNVSIVPVKFMEGTSGKLNNAIKAIKYAIDKGVQIINCSWNFENYSKELFDVIKDNPGVLFVCAAGNSNIDLDENTLYPCSYTLDNILTVGAMDNQGIISDVSGYGGKVDVLAPGVNVKVNMPEGDFDFIEGTSISSAIVTGEAALLLYMNQL